MGPSATSVQWTICERLDQKAPGTGSEIGAGKTLLDLYRESHIDPLHAQLLYNRGLRAPEEMQMFLQAHLEQIPDPFHLTDMPRALPRIQQALANSEHITVFGDFDADGVTSAALLTRALRRLGQVADALSIYIPSRLLGQRGLSKEAIDILHSRGTRLIITSDCGTSDVDEVNYAQALGIDVIITDHHLPPAQLPQPLALINTWRADSIYGERYLCGVGTAFKLAQALYREAGYEQEVWELLDLVAIGTVGDVMQLLGENHTLVRAGMQQLNQTRNPGLQALFQVARLQPGKIRERDISFVIAPRINAAGRMKDAQLAFRLLTTDDQAEAQALATELESLNASRQQQTEELMKLVRAQAELQADKQVILVYGAQADWPEGIIGLVAGKLADEMHRPAFVLSQGSKVSRGSARGPANFNIILALQAARPHLFERFGGHAQAAGFTIANEYIAELHEHLLRWHDNPQPALAVTAPEALEEIAEDTNPSGHETEAFASRKIDLVIAKPERMNMEMLKKINLLSPFGAGNPEPVFQLNNVLLQKRWTTGSEGRHLRVRLRAHNQVFQGMYLRGGTLAGTLTEGALVTVIFSLEQAWSPQGSEAKQEVSLKLLDIQPVQG